jgi:hypothetical protein
MWSVDKLARPVVMFFGASVINLKKIARMVAAQNLCETRGRTHTVVATHVAKPANILSRALRAAQKSPADRSAEPSSLMSEIHSETATVRPSP